MTHHWRMTEQELIERAVVRALRRDIANGGRAWGGFIASIAERIERGEIVLIKEEES